MEFVELYSSSQFRLNIKAVLVVAFYDDLFVYWVILFEGWKFKVFYYACEGFPLIFKFMMRIS
jgi:hypothetical protein